MTNYENIKDMTKEELADFLCTFAQWHTDGECDPCVAEKYCHRGHCGFKDWLDKDVE